MTALTTLPFLTVPSGEDSLTAAVTTSPRPAFLPEEPPRGRITCNLRAPELSATASIVLICTAICLLLLLVRDHSIGDSDRVNLPATRQPSGLRLQSGS